MKKTIDGIKIFDNNATVMPMLILQIIVLIVIIIVARPKFRKVEKGERLTVVLADNQVHNFSTIRKEVTTPLEWELLNEHGIIKTLDVGEKDYNEIVRVTYRVDKDTIYVNVKTQKTYKYNYNRNPLDIYDDLVENGNIIVYWSYHRDKVVNTEDNYSFKYKSWTIYND